jgi:uncharacterized protein (DUF1800 family)
MGLEVWLEQQISGNLPDSEVETRLAPFQSLAMTAREIVNTYPPNNTVRAQAYREGVILRDDSTVDRSEMHEKLQAFREKKGYRPQRELTGELLSQKLLRAIYSENQLVEVLTDFWFNHFNVSIQDNQVRTLVLSYERDAIRPHALGHFRDLVGATAKHPAMLFYLDNAQSTAPTKPRINTRRRKFRRLTAPNQAQMEMEMEEQVPKPSRAKRGINENYARELMELHTLGVDGGYTQKDVIEVARAFTGWTVYPSGRREARIRKQMQRRPRAFVREGDFLFRGDTHDTKEKIILGQQLPAGGEMEEGERVLDILVQHPATARHLSHKLAARFVSDNPPETLVNRLTQTFLKTDGDIRALMRTIATSPEFWREAKGHSKIKSPFELAVTTLRPLEVDVKNPRQVLEAIARMGQPLYAYQPPTGYPDYAEAWINTGTLLSRMNFGLNLALGRIRGVHFDLVKLKRNNETELAGTVLDTYAALLLPERDVTETLRQLTRFADDSNFSKKADNAASKNADSRQKGGQKKSPKRGK